MATTVKGAATIRFYTERIFPRFTDVQIYAMYNEARSGGLRPFLVDDPYVMIALRQEFYRRQHLAEKDLQK